MFSEVIWISIDSDEKPEHFEDVLTVHSLPNRSKDKVSRNLYTLDHFVHSPENIIFWAHMPDPPERERK